MNILPAIQRITFAITWPIALLFLSLLPLQFILNPKPWTTTSFYWSFAGFVLFAAIAINNHPPRPMTAGGPK